jgi:hypothetical protein
MKTKTNKIDGSFRHAVLGLARHPENAKLKELVELGRESSHLDHQHESQTNWNHAMRIEIQSGSPFGGTRRLLDEGYKSLMEIQDKQDACLRRIIELRTELSR